MLTETVDILSELMADIHKTAKDHGFWPDDPTDHQTRNFGEAIALIHSELSEALDAYRCCPSTEGTEVSNNIPEFLEVEEELADTVIRIFDLAAGFNYHLPSAIIAKMKFNECRKWKHGREF